MKTQFDQALQDRLVRYAAIDSQSDETSPSSPSTAIQFDMLNLMVEELKEIGAQDVELTEYGTVLATVPGTAEGPTVGFLAHVDTAPQFNATGVKPRVIKGYNGGDITYPDNPDLVLSPKDHPYLAGKEGHDLITASGTTLLGADDKAGVAVDERGFVPVDNQQRTGQPHIFAIGDVVGQPMLAHKAVHEGKVAAEVAAGHKRFFDAQLIPSVAYTDPEVAWCGVTETQAKAQGIKYEKGVFPWAASGRSLANGRNEGITKLLFDPEDDRVIGACIVGTNAGDLISEVALAIEMGADAVDLGHTIHPHPTLSETVNFAAEMFEGTITDLMPPKKKKA